jgi:hypothetical protein
MELINRHVDVTIALARGETLSLHDARGVRIASQDGVVWVTQERSDADHFLVPGAHVTVTQPGRTVVEALDPGSLQLSQDFKTIRNISKMKSG